MRIITGKYKNKHLESPKNDKIRPTMDRSKEALFNIINFDIINASFLDLFSGSGNIGCEAISRGANKVVCVDNDKSAINLINRNNKLVDNQLNIVLQDALTYVKQATEKFDLIFLDPPYNIDFNYLQEIIDEIFLKGIVTHKGIVILEISSHDSFNNKYIYNQKKYGASQFIFMRGLV